MRKTIFIADNFEHEISDLRKSLIASGYEVRVVAKHEEIFPQIQQSNPHLIIIETRLQNLDLEKLLNKIKGHVDFALTPLVLTGNPRTTDEKIKYLRYEIDEFFYKPFEPEELIVRLETLLKEAEMAHERVPASSGGFNGSLSEMTLVDLLQTMDVGKKTGIITLRRNSREGFTYVTKGEVMSASLEDLEPKSAILRMFTWTSGFFSVQMNQHHASKHISLTAQELISEGITRQYRWKKLAKELPPLQTVAQKATQQFENLNKDESLIAEMVNGKARFIDIVENSPFDDIKALRILKKLFENSVIQGLANSFTKTDENAISDFGNTNGDQSNTGQLESMFAKVLKHSEHFNPPGFDRRRADRRRDDRSEADRRLGYRAYPGNISLNKSELIMFRNKLIAEIQQSN
ncbi:MAG: response regulator [Calditrichaeota bacterium]|nr:MAG: response regulator [Calditrichota bacterium]